VYFDGLRHANHGPLHHHGDGGSTLYGQKIHPSQFPEKHWRLGCPCQTQAHRQNQNLNLRQENRGSNQLRQQQNLTLLMPTQI